MIAIDKDLLQGQLATAVLSNKAGRINLDIDNIDSQVSVGIGLIQRMMGCCCRSFSPSVLSEQSSFLSHCSEL